LRYALQRLWNPRTEKGLLATLRKGAAVKLVAELFEQAEVFFENVEKACEEIQHSTRARSFGGGEAADETEARLDGASRAPLAAGAGQRDAADPASAGGGERMHPGER